MPDGVEQSFEFPVEASVIKMLIADEQDNSAGHRRVMDELLFRVEGHTLKQTVSLSGNLDDVGEQKAQLDGQSPIELATHISPSDAEEDVRKAEHELLDRISFGKKSSAIAGAVGGLVVGGGSVGAVWSGFEGYWGVTTLYGVGAVTGGMLLAAALDATKPRELSRDYMSGIRRTEVASVKEKLFKMLFDRSHNETRNPAN